MKTANTGYCFDKTESLFLFSFVYRQITLKGKENLYNCLPGADQ